MVCFPSSILAGMPGSAASDMSCKGFSSSSRRDPKRAGSIYGLRAASGFEIISCPLLTTLLTACNFPTETLSVRPGKLF